MDQAKVFQNGGSQAIRLPKPYRFDTDTVFIKETPMGILLIADAQNFWRNWLAQLREGEWDVSMDDLEREPLQERRWDELFT